MISPRDRAAVQAADLLEVGELRDLHAVEPHLPAQAPGAERRRFPVVLDEAHVVHPRVEAQSAQASEVEIEEVGRRGFDHHLELVVVLQPERVVAVAAVGRAARGLHVGRAPGLGPDRAQEGRGVEGAGPDFHVIGLQDHAAALRPVALQREDQLLEGAGRRADFHAWGSNAQKSREYKRAAEAGPAAARARCTKTRRAGAADRDAAAARQLGIALD